MSIPTIEEHRFQAQLQALTDIADAIRENNRAVREFTGVLQSTVRESCKEDVPATPQQNMTEAAQLHPEDSCPHINTRAVGAPSKNISYDYADDADYLPPMLHDVDEVYDDGEMAELDFGHTGFYGHNRSNEFAPDMQCQQATGKKANSAQANGEAISTVTPGFQTDDNDVELEPENGDYVDDIISRNDDMDVYGNRNEPASGHMFSDDVEDFGASPDVDYDALADMILNDNGYGNMTVANGGVGQRNRQFMNRG